MSLLSDAQLDEMRATLNRTLPETGTILGPGTTVDDMGGGSVGYAGRGTAICRVQPWPTISPLERETGTRTASTQEWAYAGYLRDWVDRVQRVGNLNYPDEARRRQLAGELVISVAIRRDGSVERADIIRSSGIRLLDDAALRIARLAEPYPPLPVTEEEIDILHVTRTWQFLPGGELIDD